jgi:hypothetical protein
VTPLTHSHLPSSPIVVFLLHSSLPTPPLHVLARRSRDGYDQRYHTSVSAA